MTSTDYNGNSLLLYGIKLKTIYNLFTMFIYKMFVYKNFKLNTIPAIHVGASLGAIIGNALCNFAFDKNDSYIIPILIANSGAVVGYSIVNYFKKN